MGSRVSDFRRCFAILAFILIILALSGSHLPWMVISEGNHVHSWEISEIVDSSVSDVESVKVDFEMDTYFNLRSIESCQTFISETNDIFIKGQVLCSEMNWDEADQNTLDTHDWTMYTEYCEPAGLAAFILLILAIIVLVIVILLSTAKNIQRKCCPKIYTKQHRKAKCIFPVFAILSPFFAIMGIIIYFVQCINSATGHELIEDVDRSIMGYKGFWLALSGTIFLFLWWIFYTVWFCNKNAAQIDIDGSGEYIGGGSSRNPLTSKNKNKNKKFRIKAESDSEDDSEEHSRIQLQKKSPNSAVDETPAGGSWRESD